MMESITTAVVEYVVKDYSSTASGPPSLTREGLISSVLLRYQKGEPIYASHLLGGDSTADGEGSRFRFATLENDTGGSFTRGCC